MPLRVAIDVRHIRDFGIGTYIRNLVHALAETDDATQYLLASDTPDLPELANLPPNFQTVVHSPSKRDLLDSLGYSWFLRSLHADMVHMPVNVMPLFVPRPYVVTVHDMSSFLFGGRAGFRENLRLYTFRRGLMRADRVIAVSEATMSDVENLLGIPSNRIRLVYSAPDPRFFVERGIDEEQKWQTSKQQVLERYQINYPYILYAGRIRPHKNLPRLIEAFAVVRNQLEFHPVYRDLRLLIIGDEISRHPEVRRAVAQTRTQQTVRFLGFLPFDTLKIFYSAAAAFAFPSLYEGFGLPPLEAMATGTPVITSSVSSLPEVVNDAAIIVNPENVFDIARGIREVLLDENIRANLIQAGYAQARRFNWHSTAREVLKVYREVASRH